MDLQGVRQAMHTTCKEDNMLLAISYLKLNQMKLIITYCLIILSYLGYSQSASRMAEVVSFPSEDIQLEGILVKPGNADKYPVVVFQQGSGPHAFENYDEEAWGPHEFYIEDVLLKQGFAVFIVIKEG